MARIVENSPHKVSGLFLQVTFLEERGEQNLFRNTDQAASDDEANITIIVSGTLPPKDSLRNYFENSRRSGGGEVLELYVNDGDATITLTDVKGKIKYELGNTCQMMMIKSLWQLMTSTQVKNVFRWASTLLFRTTPQG